MPGLVSSSAAQIVLERQVVGATGSSFSQGNVYFSTTAGEAITGTSPSQSTALTQGFHQPRSNGPLMFSLSALPASCQGSVNGSVSIDSIRGCKPPYHIQWSSGDTTHSVNRLPAGTYTCTVETENCYREAMIVVSSDSHKPCPLKFYSGFTPNDDGQNDDWPIKRIELEYYRNNEVKIFSRWGKVVWHAENYNNADVLWAGENEEGNDLPDGTYFYFVQVNGEEYTGSVELTR